MRRILAAVVCVLAAATNVYAELTLETHPLAVTSQGSEVIVLEASSWHAAVRVFGPSDDGTPQTRSTVLILQPGIWAEEAVSYSSMSLEEAALRRIGGRSL